MERAHVAVVAIAVSFGGLISCGGAHPARLHAVGTEPRVGTTVLESARVNASETIRSCAGPTLCREDVLVSADAAALADVEDACARHGGTFGPLRCARDGAAAKCSAGSEHGTVAVFAYARTTEAAKAIEMVSAQCEAFEGSFERVEGSR